jgi:NADH dehydrogenase/NADH:ubiquinone oxidoreductase subunit G
MCVVEIEGMRGYPSSCSTPAVDGMVVHSNTEALQELRHSVLELILLEHPASCLLCARQETCDNFRPQASKAGRTTGCHTCGSKAVCNVRSLAEELNIKQLPVPPTYRRLPLDRSDPFIDRDPNLCILCGRCVGICMEHHGVQVIDFVGRGSDTRIGTAFSLRQVVWQTERICRNQLHAVRSGVCHSGGYQRPGQHGLRHFRQPWHSHLPVGTIWHP